MGAGQQALFAGVASGGGGYVAGAAVDLEADAGLGLNNDDPVTTWSDQSGNGNDASQGTAANKPTFKATTGPGGRPTVSWDSGDWLTLLSALPRSNYTIFAVLQPTAGGNKTIISGSTGGLQLRYNGSKQELIVRATASIGASNTSLSTVSFQQINVRWDGTTARFRINSTADGDVTNAQALTEDITTIGATGEHSEAYNGLISMVLVYTSVLSLADVQTNEAVIATRWGVS